MRASFGPPSNAVVFISAAMHPHLVLDPAVPGNNTHSNPTSSSLSHFTHCIPDKDQGQRSIGKHRSVQKADHTHLLRFLLLSSYALPTHNQHNNWHYQNQPSLLSKKEGEGRYRIFKSELHLLLSDALPLQGPSSSHNVHHQRLHLRLLRRPQGPVSAARLLLRISQRQSLLPERRLSAPQPVYPAHRLSPGNLTELSLPQPVPANAHLQPAIRHTKLPIR